MKKLPIPRRCPRIHCHLLKAVVLPSFLLSVSAAYSADITWSLGASGSWNDVANWSTGTLPDTSDTVYFETSSAAETITLTNTTAVEGIVINNTSTTTETSGTLTLGSGGLTINSGAGAVTLSSAVVLGASQTWTNNSTSQFTYSGGFTAGDNLGTVTLTFSGTGTFYNAYGALKDGSNTALAIVVDGGAYLKNDKSLTNSYSGGTWIKNGTIAWYNGGYGTGTITLGDTASSSGTAMLSVNNNLTISNDIVVQGGGTSIIREGDTNHSRTQTYTGSITLNNTTLLQLSGPSSGSGSIVFSGNITGSGGLYISPSSGTLYFTISGNNTFSGGITLSSGKTLNIGGANALGTGTLTLNGGTIDNTTGSALTVATANAQVWNNGFSFAGTNDLNLGTGDVSLGTASGTYRTLTISAGTLTVGGAISNGSTATGLTKSGTGTLVLTGENTYTGNTTINTGTLQLGDGTGGSLASGTVAIASGAAFVLDQANGGEYAGRISNNGTVSATASGTNTISGIISGTGDFNQSGQGTTVLNANNSYTGATTVSAGVLAVNGSLDSTSSVSVTGGGTLAGSGTVSSSVGVTNGTVHGTGLQITGLVTFNENSTLSGTNTIGGGTVASGTLSLTGQTTTSGAALSVSAGGTLQNNAGTIAGDVDVAGTLQGSGTINGSLTIESAGTFATGNTTISNNLTVSSGALVSMQLDSLSSYDQLDVSGSVSLDGTLDLTLGSSLADGSTFTLIKNNGGSAISGTFSAITISGSSVNITSSTGTSTVFTYGDTSYELDYTSGGSGNDLSLTVLEAIPEPSAWALLATGIGSLAGLRLGRRMRRKTV